MGSKTISVRDEVYERLKSRKREGESFSDLLDRLADRHADAGRFIGEYPNLGDGLEAFRDRMDREFRESREQSGTGS